ncbi:hypothetical protein DSO57_1030223 [Entomophthora muscae]|uniref:Uncharacterized protein n=3 Tax=Entomophthora muscae TaxID=34485 RepID=A0ACC2T171_9FUNG|nr:hypothetical protein DSO57_1030223 [Entomophthora muscae]
MFIRCTRSTFLLNRVPFQLLKSYRFNAIPFPIVSFDEKSNFSTSIRNANWASKIPYVKKVIRRPGVKDEVMEEGENEQEELSNRKKFMARLPKETTLKKLDAVGIGRVKNAHVILKGERARTLYDEPFKFELPSLQFFAGAKGLESIPKPTLPEIAVVGRSNVGKSRMLNAILGSGYGAQIGASAAGAVVRHADRPGVTKQLNFFTCGRLFHLVDMPGYGFAYAKDEVKAQWASIIQTYLTSRSTLRLLYLLIDARHGIKHSDRLFMDMLTSHEIKFHVVLTKCDLVVRSILARRYDMVEEELQEKYPTAQSGLFPISSTNSIGISQLRNHMIHSVGCQPAIEKYQEKVASKLKPSGSSGRRVKSNLKPASSPRSAPGKPRTSLPKSNAESVRPRQSAAPDAAKGKKTGSVPKERFIPLEKLKENIYS